MTSVIRRARTPLFSELVDWFDSGIPNLWPLQSQTHPMRIEDSVRDGRYVMKAEMAGIDPRKDLEVTVENGVLSIRAERRSEEVSEGRSEFRYGSFARSVTLPQGADENDIAASYHDGIVEVSVGLKGEQATRTIAVEVDSSPKQVTAESAKPTANKAQSK